MSKTIVLDLALQLLYNSNHCSYYTVNKLQSLPRAQEKLTWHKKEKPHKG